MCYFVLLILLIELTFAEEGGGGEAKIFRKLHNMSRALCPCNLFSFSSFDGCPGGLRWLLGVAVRLEIKGLQGAFIVRAFSRVGKPT